MLSWSLLFGVVIGAAAVVDIVSYCSSCSCCRGRVFVLGVLMFIVAC